MNKPTNRNFERVAPAASSPLVRAAGIVTAGDNFTTQDMAQVRAAKRRIAERETRKP